MELLSEYCEITCMLVSLLGEQATISDSIPSNMLCVVPENTSTYYILHICAQTV